MTRKDTMAALRWNRSRYAERLSWKKMVRVAKTADADVKTCRIRIPEGSNCSFVASNAYGYRRLFFNSEKSVAGRRVGVHSRNGGLIYFIYSILGFFVVKNNQNITHVCQCVYAL